METKQPKKPRERLASLRDPRGQRRRPPRKATPKVSCPHCQGENTVEVDGNQVCADCGELINESNIVAEITFGETSAGAAVVQGGFVGQGERNVKSLGSAFRRAGGVESREITEAHGREEIRRIASLVKLSDNLADQAFSIYKLAINNNFIQGRRIAVVASACLYISCRREATNQTLLMDFSEAIRENIFSLGSVYMELKKTLFLNSYAQAGMEPVMDVENLILKYARQLEFGSAVMKVAEDAAKVIKRMKRDWMVTGRTPAGLCGACLIIAARMNNFRRSVREVVYVVKVTDITVEKRLQEFARTQCGDLTVEEFRKYGLRLKKQSDPPALYEARVREIKRKRKLDEMQRAEAGLGEGEAPPSMPRIDRDGFVIPDLPASQKTSTATASSTQQSSSSTQESTNEDGEAEQPPKRRRGRPQKVPEPKGEKVSLSDADLLVEEELNDEIDKLLHDPELLTALEPSSEESDSAFDASYKRAETLASSLRPSASVAIPDTPDIEESEFDDDPEVKNCMLSEEESQIKEQIWVTHNEDWLRAKQAQARKKALDEAKKPKSTYQRKGRKKRNRVGDGSVLDGGVRTPEEANRKMLQKHRPNFSRHINYENLDRLYREVKRGGAGSSSEDGVGDGGGAATASASASDAGTRSPSAEAGASDGPESGRESSAVPATDDRTVRGSSIFTASPVLVRGGNPRRRKTGGAATAGDDDDGAPEDSTAPGASAENAPEEEEEEDDYDGSEEMESDDNEEFDQVVRDVEFGFDDDDDISYASGVD